MSCENCANAYDEGYTAGHNAENARLREAIGLATTAVPTMEMDAADPVGMMQRVVAEVTRLRAQADALAGAIQRVRSIILSIENRCMAADGPVSRTLEEMTEDELRGIWQASDTALRAYRESECSGCSFQRQTGGHHDDVPTGDADPNCAYRERLEGEGQ